MRMYKSIDQARIAGAARERSLGTGQAKRRFDADSRLAEHQRRADAAAWQVLPHADRSAIEAAVAAECAGHALVKTPPLQPGGMFWVAACYRLMRELLAERADRDGECD